MYSPDENNVLPYLKAMGRLKDGVDTIEKNQLRSCDKTIYLMVKKKKKRIKKCICFRQLILSIIETIAKNRHVAFGDIV
jgi:hypothetical protein